MPNKFTVIAGDTDSILFTKENQSKFSEEEINSLLNEINGTFPERIKWDFEDNYSTCLILKAKNYILKPVDKKKSLVIKGSALKDSKKLPAMKEFSLEIVEALLDGKKDRIFSIYEKYCREVLADNINIRRWATKKSITESVLKKDRTTHNQKVFDAIQGSEYQEGDKFHMYYDLAEKLKLVEHHAADHNPSKLLEIIHKSLGIFETIIDIGLIPDYNLVRNKDLLENLCSKNLTDIKLPEISTGRSSVVNG